jgi:opacity protein-like surface antigen
MLKNKLILLLSILVVCTSTAFAQVFTLVPYEEQKKSDFYIKMIYSVSKISDIQMVDPELNFQLSNESSFSPVGGVGFGYYINNKARVDLIYEVMKFNFTKQSASFKYNDANAFTTGTNSITRTAQGISLMLNGFVDLIEKRSFKIFVGTGIGAVRIKEKVSHSFSGSSVMGNQNYVFPLLTDNHTSKATTKLAYSLMLGTSININPLTNLEFMYSWKNLGKVKQNNLMNSKYKGHHFSIAARFDL